MGKMRWKNSIGLLEKEKGGHKIFQILPSTNPSPFLPIILEFP